MERRPSFAKLKPAARSFTGRYQTHMVLLKENSREGKEPRVVLRPSPTEARPRVLPAAKPRLLSKSYAALDVRPRVLPAGDGPRARPVPAPPPGKPRHGTPIRQAAAAYRKPHDLSSRAVDHADAEPHDSSPPKQLNRGGGWAGGRRLVFDRREALSPPVVAKAKSAVAVGEPPDRILPLAAAKPFVVLSYCKETDGGRGEKRMWQIANFLLRHGIHSFNRLQGSARPSAPGSDRSREWRSKLQAAGVCIALVGPKYFASSSCNAELQEAKLYGAQLQRRRQARLRPAVVDDVAATAGGGRRAHRARGALPRADLVLEEARRQAPLRSSVGEERPGRAVGRVSESTETQVGEPTAGGG